MRVMITCLLVSVWLSIGIVSAQDEPEATEDPTPQITLTIWWPETFARVGDSGIHPLLLEQAESFSEQFPNVLFDHRLKAVGQSGGIMSTLRSATNAARGALPTLTLVRRQDLLSAQSNGYLQSMEGFPSSVLGDLNNALAIGQINDELYGVPYLLEMPHIIYRPQENVPYDSWTYDAVIDRGQSIIFPAGRVNSLNDVVTLQYAESGGLSVSENELILNTSTVTDLFEYYQAAVDNDLLSAEILNYTQPTNYVSQFVAGELDTVVLNSTRYLSLVNDEPSLAIAPIPTATGATTSFLNGWVWVLVATDDAEQAIALDYLDWIFTTERHADVGRELNILPSRERAIVTSLDNPSTIEFYLNMIDNSILPLTESEIGAVGREIQTQFASILTLEQTAEDALQSITRTIGDG